MIKVLHVMKWMGHGGAEAWLMNVMRTIDRSRFSLDFLVETDFPGVYDNEIKALGGKIIYCKGLPNLFAFSWNFAKLLKEHGPYNVVHSHLHHFSGFILALAALKKVPIRIAHSHIDGRLQRTQNSKRKLYEGFTQLLIHQFATCGISCSQDAAYDLFGTSWRSNKKWQVLHCGIDLSTFAQPKDSGEMRKSFGIAPIQKIIGHVGRFTPQKNHALIAEIAKSLIPANPHFTFLLIGSGDLLLSFKSFVNKSGLQNNFIFFDNRTDIPDLMLNVMDIFLFPSLFEGLGLAFIEAQAAGLPCVVSTTIPAEADVCTNLIERVNPLAPIESWVRALQRASKKQRDPKTPSTTIQSSSFTIEQSTQSLAALYSQKKDLICH